jgi:hypothetical protein
MVPTHEHPRRPTPSSPARLALWVRGALLVLAAGLAGLFVLATRIDPYDAAGRPLRLGAHRQLGLPACSFAEWFGRPCPTCGMTTSFALLVQADVGASLRANWAGTLLAAWLAAFVPWAALSAARGRWLGGRAIEAWLLWGVIGVVALAAARWAVLVGVPWLCGFG